MKLPELPAVIPWNDSMFFDNGLCDLHFEQAKVRRAAMCDLIRNCTAVQFSDPDNPQRIFIVSPGIRGKRFSLSWFDELGAVGDWQKDTPEEFIKEIPIRYIVSDFMA